MKATVYQFTAHSNLPENSACPIIPIFQLFGKCQKQKLTREEKNLIAQSLYGTFGSHSSTYKRGGFAAPFNRVLPRILVKQYGEWREYFAPDKTSLRKAIYGKIEEMIKA